ncbi:MAG: FtsK/SpoIIIE domain-containing protein, partial [Angustibacter sp.]
RADQLTFVLVDYKGGSAFKDCARLPHTVGMVTDLNNHLVSRALVSLAAELKRREHLLVAPGAKDLEDYWALQAKDPNLPDIPRLVLVIDEFASLVAELPDFVQGLVSIAQRGRSLGIHLVLATQRPTGVVSADIRANTNLRISLRVTDEAESRDVIDAPEAARIARSTPGRGYVRTGHSTLMPFQTGRVGGRRPDASEINTSSPTPLVWPVPWGDAGLPVPTRPKPAQATTDEGETDLSLLVEVVNEAHLAAEIPDQPSPWLPPLPQEVRASELVAPDSDDVGLPAAAAWALLDEPSEQRQSAKTYALGQNSHMLIVGGPRTGRSTGLRTLVAGLAEKVSVRDMHVYGLDCGNGALLSLIELPQVGAIVTRTQPERVDRLFRRLGDELARRQEVLGELGFADIAEQRRAAASADERLPYLVLLIDRWEGFMSGLGELDNGRMVQEVQQLLKEGASAGLHVLISGDRSVINGRLVSLVDEIFAMRMPSKDDYQGLNLPYREIPTGLPDGRGIWSGSMLESQVAVLDGDLSGAGQSAAVQELGDRLELELAAEPVPDGLRPFQLEALPTMVLGAAVLPDAGPGGTPLVDSPFTWMPFGIGGDALEILGHDMEISTNVVISGLPKTGRTSVLRWVAQAATHRGQHVLGLFPRRSALLDQLEADPLGTALLGPELNSDTVLDVLEKLPNGTVVMIDDGDMAREGAASGALMALSKQARGRQLSLLTAGNVTGFGTTMSGWIHEAKREQQGLVLSPRNPGEGDVFGRRLSRSHIVARNTPGRAVLMVAGLEPVSLQVPFLPIPETKAKK